MPKYRFFLTVVIGFFFVQSACAMELVDYSNEKDGFTINFCPDDYNKNISQIKDLDLKSIRSSLKSEAFLPTDVDTLHHLLYLSTIGKNNTRKTLFTQKQQNKFDGALKVKRSVPCFFGVNGAVIICTSLFPFTNLVGLLQCSNVTQTECLSQISAIMTPTTTSVLGALMVGFVSLYATGLSPDISARRADKVQDEIGYLSRNYATIAKYWIDIYFNSPEKAQYIADKFDMEEVRIRAKSKTHKTRSSGSLVSPLEEAWHFIKHNTVLITFTEIENYLYNKIYCRRIESLEKIVHKQNAEIEKLRQEKNEKK